MGTDWIGRGYFLSCFKDSVYMSLWYITVTSHSVIDYVTKYPLPLVVSQLYMPRAKDAHNQSVHCTFLFSFKVTQSRPVVVARQL